MSSILLMRSSETKVWTEAEFLLNLNLLEHASDAGQRRNSRVDGVLAEENFVESL